MAKNWRALYDDDLIRRVETRDTEDGGADAAYMDDADYAATLYDRQLWEDADEADRAAIHARAERRRANYGYSGGAAGDAYIPLRRDNTPDYAPKHAAYIERLTREIADPAPFTYDPEGDPLWAAYKKQYTRAGQRAYEDALARTSARTGGLASSYAQGAAQQAYGDHMERLSDRLPELYKLAYSIYADEQERKRGALSTLRALENDAYGRSRDVSSDEWNARKYADARADKDYERAWKEAQTAAKYGDTSKLAALGVALPEAAPAPAARGKTQPEPEEKTEAAPAAQGDVLDLGYGPISDARLAELVKSGAVEAYEEDGKVRYRRKQPPTPYSAPTLREAVTGRFA